MKVVNLAKRSASSFAESCVRVDNHGNAFVLGLGWTYPCDIWSIGCILVELCSVCGFIPALILPVIPFTKYIYIYMSCLFQLLLLVYCCHVIQILILVDILRLWYVSISNCACLRVAG